MFQYEAKIIRVIDGDTMELFMDLGFSTHLKTLVRLAHINTPDTLNMGAKGIQDPARDFILQHCPPGSICVVDISRKEKYGRWLADVFYLLGSISRDEILLNGKNLNRELIAAGLAIAYEGGKK